MTEKLLHASPDPVNCRISQSGATASLKAELLQFLDGVTAKWRKSY
ncbi:hypothetical protein [Candidatus Methylomicrobium oryzae]|nr:hypothetical protein [Methylomicrobium sp. RS1]